MYTGNDGELKRLNCDRGKEICRRFMRRTLNYVQYYREITITIGIGRQVYAEFL